MARTVAVTREGILIDGRPFYLLSGVIHYFRYPRAEWRPLLLKARTGGVNTIDTVIPWNLHEPEPGQFHFADEADLAAYLDLCQDLGLYAIVRPGPYICAEWENGGFPAWLSAHAGGLRVDDPIFLEATLRWFDRLFPIFVERQVTRGGPVMLCQIENEHWASGRYGHDLHQTTLAQAAEQRGVEVPQYTCMGALPGVAEFRNGWNNIAEKLQQTRAAWPDNPMIVSELWSGWFDSWGASRRTHKTPASLERVLQQLTAVGCSGFSHWMLAGGTNFAFWGGRTVGGDAIHMTTSYDYDALIGEYGELRPKYFTARRQHLFLATLGAELATVLADGLPGGPQIIGQAAVPGRSAGGGGVYRSLRAHPAAAPAWRDFCAAFLDNPGADGLTVQVFFKQPQAHLAVEIEAGTIKPLFNNLPLGNDGLLLEYHSSRLLGFWSHADRDLLVVYGFAGEVGSLQLRVANDKFQTTAGLPPSGLDLATEGATLHVHYWLKERPTLVRANYSKRELHVLLLTQQLAERCWPLADGDCVLGAELVVEDGGELQIERRAGQPCYRLTRRGELDELPSPEAAPAKRALPTFGTWDRLEVAERLDDVGWQALERPLAFEELGCYLGYGWYRAELEVATAESTTLLAPAISDRSRVLLDGADIGWLGIHPWGSRYALPLSLTPGHHELRLCVDNLGRFNYGSNTGERKGLLDTLYLGGQQQDLSGGWTALWQEAVFAGEALALAQPEAVRPDAAAVHLGNFAFQGPSVWLLRTFEAQAGWGYLLQLTGDRNPGALFVNGIAVERFSRHRSGGLISKRIDDLVRPGRNVIALNIQGYAGFPWSATLLAFDPERALKARWSFRPGVTPVLARPGAEAGPAFYRTGFAYDPAIHGEGPFQLELDGLTKGQLWINGRNLGRYWQIGSQERYKLPASWLRAQNELLVFDEEGARCTRVRLAL